MDEQQAGGVPVNTQLHLNGKQISLEKLEKKANEIRFILHGKSYVFRSERLDDGSYILEEELSPGIWQRLSGSMWQSGKNMHSVSVGSLEARISPVLPGATMAGQAALSPPAPMPGLVRQVLVKKGQKVTRGQPLVVLEAMKLQLTLSAGDDAVVESVMVTVGQLVSEGAELVRLVIKK